MGGGSNYYLNERINEFKESEKLVFLIYYRLNKYFINVIDKEKVEYFFVNQLSQIDFLYYQFKIEIFLNSLVGFKDFFKVVEHIKSKSFTRLIMPIHDYFVLCPSIFLMDKNGKYCCVPSDKSLCSKCFKQQNFNKHFKSIFAFRSAFQSLFDLAHCILVFSNSSKQILEKIYQIDKDKYQLALHKVTWIKRKCKEATRKKRLNIGILGSLAHHKGLFIMQDLFLKSFNLAWQFYFFGEFQPHKQYANLTLCGEYERESLVDMVEKYDIDVFIMSSIVPETFSYVTEEIILMDKPIICFNLGAQAERVKKYHKGIIVDEISVQALQNTLHCFTNSLQK